jgi:ParB-like chromosome segregation protein Spo0J
MPTKLEGASRIDDFKFEGEEIRNLAELPQIRFGDLLEDHLESLARKIAREGQRRNVLVRKRANGTPELVDGRYRKAAILRINDNLPEYDTPFLGGKPLPLLATYRVMTDEQALKAAFGENADGLPVSVMDLVASAARFENCGSSRAEIAAILSTPRREILPGRVGQLLALAPLPRKVQDALHVGTLKEVVARQMIRLKLDAAEMERVAGEVAAGRMKAGDLTAQANSRRREAGRKLKRTLPELKARLTALDTDRALDLLAWLNGETPGEDAIDGIFADPEPASGPRRVPAAATA